MNNISYTDFQKTSFYQEFIRQNPSFGNLKVVVSTASSAYPIENAEVVVGKIIGPYRVIFFRGKTDSSGVIENIQLPSPNLLQIGSLEIPEYAIYTIDASALGYESVYEYSIGIFSGIKVLQNIVLNPLIDIEKKSS